MNPNYIKYKTVLLYNQYIRILNSNSKYDLKLFLNNLSEIELERPLELLVEEWRKKEYDNTEIIKALLSLKNQSNHK